MPVPAQHLLTACRKNLSLNVQRLAPAAPTPRYQVLDLIALTAADALRRRFCQAAQTCTCATLWPIVVCRQSSTLGNIALSSNEVGKHPQP